MLFALAARSKRIHCQGDRSARLNRSRVLKQLIAQKLKELISSKSLPFGTTPNGQAWCTKALHPSDPITEVVGIPDESAVPSLFMNYQSVYTVSPAAGATGTWSLDGQLVPHPLSFGAALYTDSVGPHSIEFLNSQLPGATHNDRLNAFLGDFTSWRLAYASVTIYQDGPDLANQGTVVVCQKPVIPRRYNPIAGMGASLDAEVQMMHAYHLEASDLPDYNASQAMPNAYFGKSREGVYIPLKLTRTHQTWHSHRDLTYQASFGTVNVATPYAGQMHVPITATADSFGGYPFLSVNDLHMLNTTHSYVGDLTSDFCNENWADFSFRNLSYQTSLSFFYRFGFEMRLQPGSAMAPHLKLSPEHDAQALDTYFRISRELKDAYPADFNDLGKIWDVISGVAKTIAPALSFIPGVGPLLSAGVPLAASMGDKIRASLSRANAPTQGSIASASDLETAREVVQSSRPGGGVTTQQLLNLRRKVGASQSKKKKSKKLRLLARQ